MCSGVRNLGRALGVISVQEQAKSQIKGVSGMATFIGRKWDMAEGRNLENPVGEYGVGGNRELGGNRRIAQ